MKSNDFQTTHWSVVLAVKGNGQQARDALRELCDLYYSPVLRFVERTIQGDASRVYGGRDAKDLTHDFFAELLQGEMFKSITREGGRFRSYLLGAVKHFLAHVREKETRIKRGGTIVHVPLTDTPSPDAPDDAVFDRDWAQSILQSVYETLGNSPGTQTLVPWITQEMDGEQRQTIAGELGMSDVAVKVALHRLRKRFRETIRAKVAQTVEHPWEINGEIDHLIKALRGITITHRG